MAVPITCVCVQGCVVQSKNNGRERYVAEKGLINGRERYVAEKGLINGRERYVAEKGLIYRLSRS